MLDKLVIHLKNIIFFKFIIYTILIMLLIAYLPRLSEDVQVARHNYNKSIELLEGAKKYFNYAKTLEKNSSTVPSDYKELFKNSPYQGCTSRSEFIQEINKLNGKFELIKPISIDISKVFAQEEEFFDLLKKVQVNNYEIRISFSAFDLNELLSISQEIYALLPQGSLVNFTEITQINAIDSDMIEDFIENTRVKQDLFNCKMHILLRQVIYKE